ncbi:MAG: TetR/AcrR family transcriptional regulator [Lachnospiraceae bacterium]|nr:TetR/AcrR family transcriptional regulator [Lachnospiraceae bacterium]
MPRVSEEYIKNKKNMIVRCAYDLCLQKTVSTVTMQDIINATGLSQGGIYRFYKDIDEIFRDMLIDNRQRVNIKPQLDEIFENAESEDIKDVLHKVFELLGDFMTRELMGIVKINFELSVLSMNAPLRVEKILGEIEGTGNFEYLFRHVSQYLTQRIMSGALTPKISIEELLTYLTTTYNGIEMSCIINHCYKKLPLMEWYVPKRQLETLETTLYYLLGMED